MKPSTRAMVATLFLSAFVAACQETRSDEVAPEPERKPTAYALHHYDAICSEPRAFLVAKAKPGEPKTVVTFSRFADDEKDTGYGQRSLRALEAWEAKDPRKVGLVACVDRKRKELSRECKFNTGAVLSYYDTTEHVRIIDPASGEVVAEERYELEGPRGCPDWHDFRKGNNLYDGPDNGRKLLAMIAALQPEGTTIPAVGAKHELGSVCRGLPFPHVAPHDPTAEHQNAFVQERFRNVGGVRSSSEGTEAADYPLVVCVTGKETKKQRDCKFPGGPVLEYHDGDVEVEIRETRTAKVIAKRTFKADGKSSRCPTMHEFYGNRDIDLGKIDPAYEAFVATFTGRPAQKASPAPTQVGRGPAPQKSPPKAHPVANLKGL
jgi:hypothetical protein